MTPAARIQATIELLGITDERPEPADQLAGGYFRKRRFIGSKDRRAVSDLLFQVIRHRAKLDWWLRADQEVGARLRVIAGLLLVQAISAENLSARFDGSRYGPAPLDDRERNWTARLAGQALVHDDQPPAVRAELPEWLYDRFAASLGDDCDRELEALGREAPVDLRANLLKTDRAALRIRLALDGLVSDPTPRSPTGLRLVGRHTLPAVAAFKEGWFEVQDEGSQLVALLADARPGLAVADVCAGAGGKTLALGAAMAGDGRLVALDVTSARLAHAAPRFERAGLGSVEAVPLDRPEDDWLAQNAGAFDRVLIDAPCSGSGAWRRNPDARWHLTPARLGEYRTAQRAALETGADLVTPGGRLVYATCSLLREENRDQAEAFLVGRPEFRLIPMAGIWRDCLGGACPSDEPTLQLTPDRHDTDGFFVAVFERVRV